MIERLATLPRYGRIARRQWLADPLRPPGCYTSLNLGVVVCVDASSSFQQVVVDTLESVCKDLHAGPQPVMDSFICFAGKAITVSGARRRSYRLAAADRARRHFVAVPLEEHLARAARPRSPATDERSGRISRRRC